jgi:hypothetical protein
VVTVRTEREPNLYEPLHETHRRVAEDEEKRRLAEQEQARSASAQPEPEPDRPGTELRPQRPEAAPEHDPNSPEVRLAAKEQELQEQVRLGRINSGEMIYQLRQFDNELLREMKIADSQQARDAETEARAEPKREGTEQQQTERPSETEYAASRNDERNPEPDRFPVDVSRDVPKEQIKREAEVAEYETVGRGGMTDARAARLGRLRGIYRDIERENRVDNEGKGPDLDHDSGDRSR